MLTFLKAQVASLIASAVDYFCTIVLVEVFGFWPVWASSLGTFAGGVVNFSMSRRWVFSARDEKATLQMKRYLIVWVGYLLLTTLFVYLLTHSLQVNYIITKVCVSFLMGIFYNYPLQKKFVFN
ncbi:MAG: GtrA family protein [Bacteroidota bacterium]